MLIPSLEVKMVSNLCCFHIDTLRSIMSTLGLLLSSKYKISFSPVFFSYFLPFGLTPFQFLCTRQTLLVNMSLFITMKTSTPIIFQMLLGIILDEFYGVNVDVILKFHGNSFLEIYTSLMMYGRLS